MAPAKKSGTPPTQPPVDDITKTGGEGDDDNEHDGLKLATARKLSRRPDLSGRGRKALVTSEDFEFTIGSLVGSWFLRLENDRIIWQGVVVAEPQPGVYLLQIDKLDEGAENVQRLVPLLLMVSDDEGYDWRFYDTENQARSAYAHWVTTERKRA